MKTLGATRWRTFLEVTLPLSLPGLAAGGLLAFVTLTGRSERFRELIGRSVTHTPPLRGATAAALPPKSYGAWAVRDLTGMSVVFTLPPLLAPKLAAATDMNLRSAETFLQFTLPMAIQPVVAPFHQLVVGVKR